MITYFSQILFAGQILFIDPQKAFDKTDKTFKIFKYTPFFEKKDSCMIDVLTGDLYQDHFMGVEKQFFFFESPINIMFSPVILTRNRSNVSQLNPFTNVETLFQYHGMGG